MDANVISSHTIFSVKNEDDGKIRLESEIVIHGNLDAEKNEVRTDCTDADMILVRIILCLGA